MREMPNFRVNETRLETLDEQGLPTASRLATPAESAMWGRLSKVEPAVREVVKAYRNASPPLQQVVADHLVPLINSGEDEVVW